MEQLSPDSLEWLEKVLALCTASKQESQERIWIRERFEDVARSQHLSGRGALDRLVFERLYGRQPEKSTEQLPIRYWRTGRHKPQSREQCLALGRALELEKAEITFLLQSYYDSVDRVFAPADRENPVYRRRREYLARLEEQYLAMAHPLVLEQLRIPWEKAGNYLRHYYVQDARQYVEAKNKVDGACHLNSANYVNEFQHLRFLMGGERTDILVLKLLERYRQECVGKAPVDCQSWLRRTCRIMDGFLQYRGHPELRFLYFKALDGEKKKARE